jgi:AcrR family transcriptional regulator
MNELVAPDPATPAKPVRERILAAAFAAFVEGGYANTTTLDIARRARVSKRDLYANFGSKQAMLAACVTSRAERIRLPPGLPAPESREMLAAALREFATNLMRETTDLTVIAAFRLAIAEATRSPEIAETLDSAGREVTRQTLVELLASAQAAELIGAGEPAEMAGQFFGLLWEGLMVSLLLGVTATPEPFEIGQRAQKASAAFMRLYPDPAASH